MLIKIPDEIVDTTAVFLQNNGFEATDKMINYFLQNCAIRGMNQIMEVGIFMRNFQIEVQTPQTEPLNIPPGGVCPQCDAKILIGQNGKIACNCRTY